MDENKEISINRECFPDWFEEKTGFTFLDDEEDIIVVLGEGKVPGSSSVGLIAAVKDKDSWCTFNLLSRHESFWEGARPISEKDTHLLREMCERNVP